jgi:hypothetical protein
MVENKDLIGYCGLYCGDCFSYKGEIADLARDLRKKLREEKFNRLSQEWAKVGFFKELKNYRECYEVLDALVKFRCKKTCRGGGGPPFCEVRKCCQAKGIQGCWECDEFETCDKLDFLKPIHKDAHLKNLRKIMKKGVDEFLKGKRYW